MSLLDIENLRVSFKTADGDVNAVNGVSFGIDAGETLAGKKARTGPNLYGIAGRTAGSIEGFKYSDLIQAAGADGIMVEVHPNPAVALSDQKQQMDFDMFDEYLEAVGYDKKLTPLRHEVYGF